jgi:hypothetical protein
MHGVRLGAFRRSRLLAGLLLLASPAAAGTVLPVLHPCPVDAPWLAESQAAEGHAGHHGSEHRGPSENQHANSCNCIGGCTAGSLVLAPRGSAAVPALFGVPSVPAWHSHDASLLLAPLAALLPPATAPPVA